MWKNLVEPDWPQMKIGRMGFASRIPKATNTHSECVTFIAFPQQQWLRERAPVLHHTYIASLNLTFIGPCIVKYSYSTTNKMHLLSQIIYSCKTLCMFRTVFPSIIRSSKLRIQQRYMSNSCCYLLLSGMRSLMAAGSSSTCLTYTVAVYAVLSS